MKRPFSRLNALQVLAVGFIIIILTGGCLLNLSIASKDGKSINFLNAVFTSTSATCVTGLVVADTYSQFTLFGQVVILLLIQIGGLGFMTFAVLISMIIGKRIGLKERSYLMEAVNSLQLGGVVRLTRRILLGTALFEGTGALLLSIRFIPDFGLGRGLWYSVFHSVSAFCNAGFDLMGVRTPFSSLTAYADDPLVCGVIMGLIIIGGVGFIVWNDVANLGLHVRKYRLHTKLMLLGTLCLILFGATFIFFVEKDASMADMNVSQRILASLFQAVTARTAGFNTVDITSLSEAGSIMTMLNMFIGAGPGSTAGGIKLTTFVVILLSVVAYCRGQEDINLWDRRLEFGIVRRAYCGAMLYGLMALVGIMVLVIADNLNLSKAAFECLSAIGTVGLSKSVTPGLSQASKVSLILLMYAGRVGSLSVAMAFAEKKTPAGLRNPVEKIIIG